MAEVGDEMAQKIKMVMRTYPMFSIVRILFITCNILKYRPVVKCIPLRSHMTCMRPRA